MIHRPFRPDVCGARLLGQDWLNQVITSCSQIPREYFSAKEPGCFILYIVKAAVILPSPVENTEATTTKVVGH